MAENLTADQQWNIEYMRKNGVEEEKIQQEIRVYLRLNSYSPERLRHMEGYARRIQAEAQNIIYRAPDSDS
jgi:hypothetical protein